MAATVYWKYMYMYCWNDIMPNRNKERTQSWDHIPRHSSDKISMTYMHCTISNYHKVCSVLCDNGKINMFLMQNKSSSDILLTTLTFSQGHWLLGSAHGLNVVNIYSMLFENPSRGWSVTRRTHVRAFSAQKPRMSKWIMMSNNCFWQQNMNCLWCITKTQ